MLMEIAQLTYGHFARSVIGFSYAIIFVITYNRRPNRLIIMIKQIKIHHQAKNLSSFLLLEHK